MTRYLHLHVLGAKAASPSSNENTSSFLLESDQQFFLIDCGEGTQRELRRRKFKFGKLHTILISHLHGDHIFGLPGLLTSLSLLGRKSPITILGPVGIKAYMQQVLALTYSQLSYTIVYREIPPEAITPEHHWEDNTHIITPFALSHRVPTVGYSIRQKPLKRKLNSEKINAQELPVEFYKELTQGQDVLYNDRLYKAEKYTYPSKRGLHFAYCSDTAFEPNIVPHIEKSDLLYHEATYLDDRAEMGKRTGHSTARQAGEIAQLAEVNQLVIGHLSSRIKDKKMALSQAKELFENTELYSTREGHRVEI